jgi:hypothetical protein
MARIRGVAEVTQGAERRVMGWVIPERLQQLAA